MLVAIAHIHPHHLPIHLIDVLRLGSFSPKIQDTLEEFGTVADARLTKKSTGAGVDWHDMTWW